MAKWGEGDPRWIVEERADATNVNNWHWFVSALLTIMIIIMIIDIIVVLVKAAVCFG